MTYATSVLRSLRFSDPANRGQRAGLLLLAVWLLGGGLTSATAQIILSDSIKPTLDIKPASLTKPATSDKAAARATRTRDFQPAPERPWAVNVQLGTTGAGLRVSHLLNRRHRLYGQAGLSFFSYNSLLRLQVSKDGDGSYIQITPDLVIGIAQAGLRWYPFRRGAFYLTGGIGYTWHPDLTFTVIAENKLDFGGLTVTPENVGTIQAGLRWKNVLGYGGFGFGRAIPRRRVGFGAELGMYYLGKPKVILNYDGFLETTTIDEQIPKVEENLSGYRYLPALTLFVSVGIGKK